jgi:hypothetical protein
MSDDRYHILQLENQLADLRREFDAFVRATIESAQRTQDNWVKTVLVLTEAQR